MNCSSRPILKIGRTPVHQALDRLMIEGMVEVIPRKGVIVKPVSLNEVLQIIEVRLINETFGSRLAAEHADDSDLAELAEVLRAHQILGITAQRREHDVARSGISFAHSTVWQERGSGRAAAKPARTFASILVHFAQCADPIRKRA